MVDQHIAPDDFTFGAAPVSKAFPQLVPKYVTPDDRAQALGFLSDNDMRRWCIGEVIQSKVCCALSTEARALYDFLTETA